MTLRKFGKHDTTQEQILIDEFLIHGDVNATKKLNHNQQCYVS